MELPPANARLIRGYLKQVNELMVHVANLLPTEEGQRAPHVEMTVSTPTGWKSGQADPVTGELVPLEESAREWLKNLAHGRGVPGTLWLPAIEAARTEQDGRDLRRIIKELPLVKYLADPPQPASKLGPGKNGL